MRKTTLNDGRRWVAVRNTTEETIPSFGVMAIQDVTTEDGEAVFTVGKADLDLVAQVALGDLSRLLINGPLPIKSLGSGSGTGDFPTQVYTYQTGVLADVYWGPVVDQWGVYSTAIGFRSLGTEATPDGSNALWLRPVGPSRVMAARWGSAANPILAMKCLEFASFGSELAYGAMEADPDTPSIKINVRGWYKLTCHASIGPVDSMEGEMVRLTFVTFTGATMPADLYTYIDHVDEGSFVGARALAIDADGTDLGYGADPLYTVENVSMSGYALLDVDDKITVGNYSFADIQVYHCQLWAELIRTTE